MPAPIRARRPLPLRRISAGASSTTSSSSSGTELKQKSFWVPEWKRSVVETMITPSRTRARMLSIVCETRVPSSTGTVSRIRPVRRESDITRAGSPRRAGSVADISTPIIVAEVTSRRRTGRLGSAARTIAVPGGGAEEERGRHQRAGDQHPGEVGADDAGDDLVDADLVRRQGGEAEAEDGGDAEPEAAGALRRRLPLRARGGSSEGRRSAGRRGRPSAEAMPARRASRSPAVDRRRAPRSPARRPRSPGRRRGARRSARR